MERDEKGRFLKRQAVSRDEIKDACSAEKVEQVLEALRSLALTGNTRAGELYLAYTIGKPAPSTEKARELTWREEVERILNGDDSETSAA